MVEFSSLPLSDKIYSDRLVQYNIICSTARLEREMQLITKELANWMHNLFDNNCICEHKLKWNGVKLDVKLRIFAQVNIFTLQFNLVKPFLA